MVTQPSLSSLARMTRLSNEEDPQCYGHRIEARFTEPWSGAII